MSSLLVSYISRSRFNDFFVSETLLLFTLNKRFFLDVTEDFLKSKNIINFINKLLNKTATDIAIICFSFEQIL